MGVSKGSIERMTRANLTIEAIAAKARELNMWIYDPQLKDWFSPEEFLWIMRDIPRGHELLARMQYKNPVEGLEAAHAKLRDFHFKVYNFSKRVFEYYLETNKKAP